MQETAFVVERLELTAQHAVDPVAGRLPVIRVDERLRVHVEELLALVASDRTEGVVDLEKSSGVGAGDCDDCHTDARALEGASEALLGFARCEFDVLALGDVADSGRREHALGGVDAREADLGRELDCASRRRP